MKLLKISMLSIALMLSTNSIAQEKAPAGMIHQFTATIANGKLPHIYWNRVGKVNFLCVVASNKNTRCYSPQVLMETPVLAVDFEGIKITVEDQR